MNSPMITKSINIIFTHLKLPPLPDNTGTIPSGVADVDAAIEAELQASYADSSQQARISRLKLLIWGLIIITIFACPPLFLQDVFSDTSSSLDGEMMEAVLKRQLICILVPQPLAINTQSPKPCVCLPPQTSTSPLQSGPTPATQP